jgi:hypothetical protein
MSGPHAAYKKYDRCALDAKVRQAWKNGKMREAAPLLVGLNE